MNKMEKCFAKIRFAESCRENSVDADFQERAIISSACRCQRPVQIVLRGFKHHEGNCI